jgi:hypothetical protein
MNKDFFQDVKKFIHLKIRFIGFFLFLVTGQNNSGVGGYVDEYQNPGGAKQQFLNLVRSVRTVMRG